ncbi:MAG TPA: universal stress protein [Xanthobacteraceae bacterium]|jgi:nucleotide-binding universal stress UspA family protein
MIKDIAFHLSTRASGDATIDYAVSVAVAFEAHLAGIAFALDPFIPPTMGIGDSVPVDWIDEQRAEGQGAALAVIARFEEVARRNGVSAEARRVDASLAGAAETFGRMARRFDLSVVRQAEPGKAPLEDLVIEAALFDAGRPVLVVPYIQKAGLTLDRVLVTWDGGRSAARAVGDAMPFLRRAKAVEVVIVQGDAGKSDDLPGADIGEHLARHDLEVDVKRIVATEGKVGDTLLSHVADVGADLLVMGGYGHSRLREFILGGVTRGILGTMTVPVLMSH